jgi:hypothetical protein
MSLLFFLFHIVTVISAEELDSTTGETVSSEKEGTWETTISPFYACSVRRTATDHEKVTLLQRRIPKQDRRGIKTRDFLLNLSERIEQAAQNNLTLTNDLTTCFSPVFVAHASSRCEEMREWSLKDQAVKGAPEDTTSLWYQTKVARAHLAIATQSLSSREWLNTNRELSVFDGYKTVPWNPLTEEEDAKAQNHLKQYSKQFQKLRGLTDVQLEDLIASRNQQGHKLRQDFLLNMRSIRRKHLEEYRKIVSKFPIINYLSSPVPTAGEIYSAGMRMQLNAKKELKSIQDLKKKLQNASDDNIPSETLRLMEYTGLVEGFLSEQPEFCAVATAAQEVKGERELGNAILVTAPLLAACILAPPMTSVVIGAAAGGAIAGASYMDYKDYEGALLSTPINDGSQRADLATLNDLKKQLTRDLVMIPVDAALGGVASRLSRGTRALKPSKK